MGRSKTYDNRTDIDGKSVREGDTIVYVGTCGYYSKPLLHKGVVHSFTKGNGARVWRGDDSGEADYIGKTAVYRVNERED